jgi:hypothetical protein
MLDEAFKNWFIGFTEGEGSFTYTALGYPRFSITQKNKAILDVIKDTLGFGSVCIHSKIRPDTWRYAADHNWKNMNTLKEIFEGNLRTDFKKKQFAFWLGLWDRNHPLRVAGRERERKRIRDAYLRDPQLKERHRDLVRIWNHNHLEKRREYGKKSRLKKRILIAA